MLLIVPYGIETPCTLMYEPYRKWLLIVPYGIETWDHPAADAVADAFNRTLWN